jgi:hypothetical protein
MNDTAMRDLATRGALLEYWFWKVGTRDGAAIIDFILRRDTGQATIRAGTWSTVARPVAQLTSGTWATTAGGVRIDDARLDVRGSTGSAGDGVTFREVGPVELKGVSGPMILHAATTG